MMNKKICVFTQTYGNSRQELYTYHNRDVKDIYFRNNFENIYAFHNCDDRYVAELMSNDYFNKINNLEVIRYNGMPYTQSFRQTIHKLKELGYNYIIFLQDDCFTENQTVDIDSLVNFINNYDFNMLNLEIINKYHNQELLYDNEGLKVFNTTSNDMIDLWNFDDGGYVANIDYLLSNVYDETYFNKGEIWEAEGYLYNKIKNNPIQRLITNYCIYNRINIVGRNNWNRENELNKLNNKLWNIQ